jgi:hypothetical protein
LTSTASLANGCIASQNPRVHSMFFFIARCIGP